MMLPKFVSEICGLGSTNETRTFVVESRHEKSLCKDFETRRATATKYKEYEAVANQVKTSSNVRYCRNQFPSKVYIFQAVKIAQLITLSDDTKKL